MDQDEYNKLYVFLKTGELPSGLNSSHSRFGFKRKCRSYELDSNEDALYYLQKHKDGTIRRRAKVVVGTLDDARNIFNNFHCAKPTPHPGLNRTIQDIAKNYFWPRMTYNIIDWVRQCSVCTELKENDKTKLHQLKISEPWEILTMNIIGPVAETPEGYKYIFVATDFYSKWVEAFPICNKYPSEVGACLKLIFYRHGAWKSVLSKEDVNFVQQVNAELSIQFGGDHHVKAVYHPDVMTLDKKCEIETESLFNSLVLSHTSDWPHYIDGLLFMMRTKKHPATKFTPFYLLHKREPRLPPVPSHDRVANIDSVFDLRQIAPPQYEASQTTNKIVDIRTHEKTIENLKQAHFDQLIENALAIPNNHQPRQFTVGEKVLMTNCRKRPFDFCTSDRLVSGPYVVTDVKTNRIKIMSVKDHTQVKVITEFNRLVPYKEMYKLSIFEPVSDSVDLQPISQTTLQIITCDSQFSGEDEINNGRNEEILTQLEAHEI